MPIFFGFKRIRDMIPVKTMISTFNSKLFKKANLLTIGTKVIATIQMLVSLKTLRELSISAIFLN